MLFLVFQFDSFWLLVLLLQPTGFTLPGEPQHSAVVSVSEHVGQAEVSPVFLREKTQQFLWSDKQRMQRIRLIRCHHHLEKQRQ